MPLFLSHEDLLLPWCAFLCCCWHSNLEWPNSGQSTFRARYHLTSGAYILAECTQTIYVHVWYYLCMYCVYPCLCTWNPLIDKYRGSGVNCCTKGSLTSVMSGISSSQPFRLSFFRPQVPIPTLTHPWHDVTRTLRDTNTIYCCM